MTIENIRHELKLMPNAALANRKRTCQNIANHPNGLKYLIQLTFEVDDKLSIRAAWILEIILKDNLYSITTFLDTFCKTIKLLKFDSSKRPCAKICELIAIDYDQNKRMKSLLTSEQKELLISCCFDWMISDEKLAVQAYSMMVLFIFGKEESWIHSELKSILIEQMGTKSPGYKSRGLKLIKLM
ncbi:MAG: adenylosuccinate lyase [Flavobacteriales bacterium]